MPTTKEHIDAAIESLTNLRGGDRAEAAREFSIAITALEDAKMRTTRGLAKRLGIFNEVDLEQQPGIDRALANYSANVADNQDGSPQRS